MTRRPQYQCCGQPWSSTTGSPAPARTNRCSTPGTVGRLLATARYGGTAWSTAAHCLLDSPGPAARRALTTVAPPAPPAARADALAPHPPAPPELHPRAPAEGRRDRSCQRYAHGAKDPIDGAQTTRLVSYPHEADLEIARASRTSLSSSGGGSSSGRACALPAAAPASSRGRVSWRVPSARRRARQRPGSVGAKSHSCASSERAEFVRAARSWRRRSDASSGWSSRSAWRMRATASVVSRSPMLDARRPMRCRGDALRRRAGASREPTPARPA